MILHIDMDAFYASVEEREQPALIGKPVIVGGGAAQGVGSPLTRGVVCAANYAAREYGVHSAMPLGRAMQLCPHAIRIPPRMSFYGEVSERIREIFQRYTPLVEPLSLDEAFLDVSACLRLFGSAENIGKRIQGEIHQELGLPSSVGIAPNKFLAKLASDLRKPAGFVVVPADGIQEFLDPLDVTRLWGVGRVTAQKLQQMQIRSILDLRQRTLEWLAARFGKVGEHLHQLSHGIDNRQVVPERAAKSISHETTFAEDLCDEELLRSWLLDLTDQVAGRLRRQQLTAKTVHLKLRYADFHTITRSQSLPQPSNLTDLLWRTVDGLFTEKRPARRLIVRLLGMGVSGLTDKESKKQSLLFDEADSDGPGEQRQAKLDSVTDDIRAKFGKQSLKRGRGIR